MPASSNFLLAKGREADSAITKKRFVKMVSGEDAVEQCDTDGERAYGVAIYGVTADEINQGKLCSVLTDGRAIVEASVAIAEGENVTTTNDGRAKVAASGDWIIGMCDEPAGASGDECSVDLTKGGHLLV